MIKIFEQFNSEKDILSCVSLDVPYGEEWIDESIRSLDPYNEENWDEVDVIAILLFRNNYYFDFNVVKGKLEDRGRPPRYSLRYIFRDINGNELFETSRIININDVDEEIELSDGMNSSGDAIILPESTSREDINKIISRVHERIYRQQRRDVESQIKSMRDTLNKTGDLNKIVKYDNKI
jgi:hypothetical protein